MDVANPQHRLDDALKHPIEDAPTVQFVQNILNTAIHQKASDIHFESYETQYRIRMRIDGILYELDTPPPALAKRIAACLKVMAQLNIAEHRLPQDGRFRIKQIDFRISTCPTIYGEKIVLRLLDPNIGILQIDSLGLEAPQQSLILNALSKPQGMILVTGPTGSGKTLTLYSMLNVLNSSQRNLMSVEDPVEIQMLGLNQVNVSPKIGLSFATLLRTFLRQDPDIIMVGEIRDLETAEIAIKAAQTGHMVLSTLHTNNAIESISRLVYMGIPSYQLATSISLIIAQRLVRKLCEHCKKPEIFSNCSKKTSIFYQAIGCQHCQQGYQGRIGIFEILEVTDAIREMLFQQSYTMDIQKYAQQNSLLDLHTAGILKAKSGLTSLEEIKRVIKDEV